jgi:RNA polymerase sigma-70 factor (ECF subfamily)
LPEGTAEAITGAREAGQSRRVIRSAPWKTVRERACTPTTEKHTPHIITAMGIIIIRIAPLIIATLPNAIYTSKIIATTDTIDQENSHMRNEIAANRALELYSDTVRRICFIHLKNHADVDDVFQEVFLKYILHDDPFESDAHEKAWIIRVSINACKDVIKSFFRKNVTSFDELYDEPFYLQEQETEVLDAVLKLPEKYRDVIYLYYYEGYTAVEIAKIMGKNNNTIYTWLDRARKKLRDSLEGESNGK